LGSRSCDVSGLGLITGLQNPTIPATASTIVITCLAEWRFIVFILRNCQPWGSAALAHVSGHYQRLARFNGLTAAKACDPTDFSTSMLCLVLWLLRTAIHLALGSGGGCRDQLRTCRYSSCCTVVDFVVNFTPVAGSPSLPDGCQIAFTRGNVGCDGAGRAAFDDLRRLLTCSGTRRNTWRSRSVAL
jgi:hypothetical protein